MASVGPELCTYCGSAPCVGGDCPSNFVEEIEGDYGACELCGVALRIGEVDGICCRCADDDFSVTFFDPSDVGME